MKRSIVIALGRLVSIGLFFSVVLGFTAPLGADESDDPLIRSTFADPTTTVSRERIESLIEQLGSETHADRLAAEAELLEIGYDAFDQLKAAEQNRDAEVSARARYLTRLLTVTWTRESDSAGVQKLMGRYSNMREDERLAVLHKLASLPNDEGFAALCRVVRFDDSPIVSKQAAAKILSMPEHSGRPPEPEVQAERIGTIRRELGSSMRPAAAWLRTYMVEMKNPAETVPAWRRFVEVEVERLNGVPHPQQRNMTLNLMHHVVACYQFLQLNQDAVALMQEMVEIDVSGESGVLRRLVTWLIEHEDWDLFDGLAEKHEDRFKNEPILMYMLAEARQGRGDNEQATQLADRAFKLSEVPAQRVDIGDQLDERGLYEWAEKELATVLDSSPPLSYEAMQAAYLLATMLHDINRNEDASKVFTDYVHSVRTADNKQVRFFDEDDMKEQIKSMESRASYFAALAARDRLEWEEARRRLEESIKHDPRDIDVLIAMYHLQGVDEAFEEDVRKRIKHEAALMEARIRKSPRAALNYNNWAWLISNTTGDQQKAVRYAQKAVELASSRSLPGFLDTLARAHYAVGNFEEAVKYQRKACGLDPHTQQMQRQLKQIEKALEQSRKDAA